MEEEKDIRNLPTMFIFKAVIELVEQGLTIRQALKKLKIGSYFFYDNITPIQKAELKAARIAQSGRSASLEKRYLNNY